MSSVEWAPYLWKYGILPPEELWFVTTDSRLYKGGQVQVEAITGPSDSLPPVGRGFALWAITRRMIRKPRSAIAW